MDGICALCNEKKELVRSHLIPKFVYKRIRTFPNSHFRNVSNFNKEIQDGEKYPMLCRECEELFNSKETWFAKHFLDVFIKDKAIPQDIDMDMLDYYLISVAWRIIWDDLYRNNSFDNDICRSECVEFEQKMRNYLYNNIQNDFFEYYIYKISDFIECSEKLSNSVLFGYTFYNYQYGPFIIVYYLGLVYVTRFIQGRRIAINVGKEIKCIDEIIAEEINYIFNDFQKKLKLNYTEEFVEKMKKKI